MSVGPSEMRFVCFSDPGFNPLSFIANDIAAAMAGAVANVVGIADGVARIFGHGYGADIPQTVGAGISEVFQSLLPRYGNFGGPGYGVGRDPNLPPLFRPNPFNPEDGANQKHDNWYHDSGNPLTGDQQLLRDLWHISQPGPSGQMYRAGAIILLE